MLFFEMLVMAPTRNDLWFQHLPITHRPLLNWMEDKQIRSSKNKGSAEIVNGKTNISVINASCCRNIRFTLGFNTVLVEVLFH